MEHPRARQRRTRQFSDYLKRMDHRAHEIAHGPSFMVFDVQVPDTGARPDRFVQFSFERTCFHLDMPSITLSRDEANEIIRRRERFFHLSEKPEFQLHEEDVDGHDPFRAVYQYGEEDVAASDMAFIVFDVWGLPLRTLVLVSAAAFEKAFEWEYHQLIP